MPKPKILKPTPGHGRSRKRDVVKKGSRCQKSCYAPKSGTGGPHEKRGKRSSRAFSKQELPRIPSTPIGIVDTLRVQLNRWPDECDIDDLRWSGQRWQLKNGGRTLCRPQDGLRIYINEDRVAVEVSVPRLLGLFSDEQHHVTEEDLLGAFRMMTSDLLPRTTSSATEAGHRWHVTRLDLAINFKGCVREIIVAARNLDFLPRIQAPATVFEGSGIAFYGANHDAIVYRTDKRPPRGKLKRSLAHQRFRRTARQSLRFEFRFKGRVAIQRLLEGMSEADPGLPFEVDTPEGRKVRIFRLDYQFLHRKLAHYARRLGESGAVGGKVKERGASRFLVEALARYGDEIPELWALAHDCLSERTIRKRRAAINRRRASLEKRRSVVEMAWDRPRVSGQARKRMLAQVAADPGLQRLCQFLSA